jgi:hypothetical protein
MVKSYDNKNLEKLPRWARDLIADLAAAICRYHAIEQMHGILSEKDREWFALPGPVQGSDRQVIKLWVFNQDDPLLVASLYEGDKLFVGRERKMLDEPQKEKEKSSPGKGQAGNARHGAGSSAKGKRAPGKQQPKIYHSKKSNSS